METMLSCNLERGMELPFKFAGSAIHFFFFLFLDGSPTKTKAGAQ